MKVYFYVFYKYLALFLDTEPQNILKMAPEEEDQVLPGVQLAVQGEHTKGSQTGQHLQITKCPVAFTPVLMKFFEDLVKSHILIHKGPQPQSPTIVLEKQGK